MNVAAILEACEVEVDEDRRGAQMMLAAARVVDPHADLAGLVALAATFHPRMRELNPAMVADVARRMGLA